MDGNVMALVYVTEYGEKAEIEPKKFIPLSYKDLPGKNSLIKLYPIEVISDSIKINGHQKGPGTVSARIEFHEELNIYALVKSGWLPMPFVLPPIFYVDQNVVLSIKKIKTGSVRSDLKAKDWWFKFFKNKEITINPLFYALEGSKKKQPSYDELCVAYSEAKEEILEYLPNAKIIQYKSAHFKGAYGLLSDLNKRTENEIKFLKICMPLVIERGPVNKLSQLRDEIIRIADSCHLKSGCLSLVAVLSCLYEDERGEGLLAARRILKPKTVYSDEDAYNSFFDLRMVELFLIFQPLNDKPCALCTCDDGLAAFWCGIQPARGYLKGEIPSYKITITEVLFPRMAAEERASLFAFCSHSDSS